MPGPAGLKGKMGKTVSLFWVLQGFHTDNIRFTSLLCRVTQGRTGMDGGRGIPGEPGSKVNLHQCWVAELQRKIQHLLHLVLVLRSWHSRVSDSTDLLENLVKEKQNSRHNPYVFTPHVSIDEAAEYLTAAGRAHYFRLPWCRVWQNCRIFISQNSVLAELQLISKLLFHRCTEQKGGFAKGELPVQFSFLLHAGVCVCVCICVSGWVCILGFKALACLFPLRVTGVLMACQVSQETRDTGWDGFDNVSPSRLKGPLGRLCTADVY